MGGSSSATPAVFRVLRTAAPDRALAGETCRIVHGAGAASLRSNTAGRPRGPRSLDQV